MTPITTVQKLEEAFKRVKKSYVAYEVLDIARTTLDRKLRDNDFSPEEIRKLKKSKIIN